MPTKTESTPDVATIPTSIRINRGTQDQIDALTAAGWGNKTSIITVAIDRMFRQEFAHLAASTAAAADDPEGEIDREMARALGLATQAIDRLRDLVAAQH